MLYMTGIYALNLRCLLHTSGDWHIRNLDWSAPKIKESETMPWREWGIETGRHIPNKDGIYAIADHLRALLDMIYDGQYALARGMKDDYICNDAYTLILFEKVQVLESSHEWPAIDKFMDKEYPMEWHYFLHPEDRMKAMAMRRRLKSGVKR